MNEAVLEALTELASDDEFGAVLTGDVKGMGDKLSAYLERRGVPHFDAEVLALAYQQGVLHAIAWAGRTHQRAMREAVGE